MTFEVTTVVPQNPKTPYLSTEVSKVNDLKALLVPHLMQTFRRTQQAKLALINDASLISYVLLLRFGTCSEV